MRGLAWGELYETYHSQPYSTQQVRQRVEALLADEFVSIRRGIFEYILGGEVSPHLLNIRIFDDRTKKQVFYKQTSAAPYYIYDRMR